MELLEKYRCFDGEVGYYTHSSTVTGCDMRFTAFIPESAAKGKCATLFYLAGLTCTEENFTVKAGAYRYAAELGLILIAPDTSPRGEGVADAEETGLGMGAGFYVDATEKPWQPHYRMYSYITEELRTLVCDSFPADPGRLGIFGHSMGGHGALTIALKRPDIYRSVSAFAPICAPMSSPWGQNAFTAYLGGDKNAWKYYDATELLLIQGRPLGSSILIDQGLSDNFLTTQLHPHLFEAACKKVNQGLALRRHEGYGHGYFFIQTFMEDHLQHHAAILAR